MLLEALQILVDEPEKVSKAILKLFKTVLSLIFASYLYEVFFGNYELVKTINYDEIYDYIVSGRLIVGLILFIFSNFLLFTIGSIISEFLLKGIIYILKPVSKLVLKGANQRNEEEKLINRLLIRAKYIEQNKNNPKDIMPGEKIDEFYAIVKDLSSKEAKSYYLSYQKSLVSDIWHTFFVFTVVYYFILKGYNSKEANFIIIFFYFFIPILYVIVKQYISFVNKNGERILSIIRGLRLIKAVIAKLQDLGCYVIDAKGKHTRYAFKVIGDYNFHILFKYSPKARGYEQYAIEKAIKIAEEELTKVVIISNRTFTDKAMEMAQLHSDRIEVIVFDKKKELLSKLEDYYNHGNKSISINFIK